LHNVVPGISVRLISAEYIYFSSKGEKKLDSQSQLYQGISAMILAGGKSSRMGRDKASLPFRGMSLLEWQVQKLSGLGIKDIMLSGCRQSLEGTRTIPDEYSCRGPLSGIHACMKQALNPCCLTLSVDMPLVPDEVFAALAQAHLDGDAPITLLQHGGKWEPLLGIYNCSLYQMAELILKSEKTAVRRLLDETGFQLVDWPDDEMLFLNCNIPEDFVKLLI